jgi:hypothetical protein
VLNTTALVVFIGLFALIAASCASDSEWSSGLQKSFAEVCEPVATDIFDEFDIDLEPESHCGCLLVELQQEFTEEGYLAMSQPDRDKTAESYGSVCARRVGQ